MAKVLITGARGMLGRRLVEAFAAASFEVVATARQAVEGSQPLDVTDEPAVRNAVAQVKPDWIVNAAAYTAVDRAESEEAEAFKVNADAPRFLAQAAREHHARFLHVSTDFVFRGDRAGSYAEDDAVGPVGAYARSKEAGERRVREALPAATIVRVAWLFGKDGKNFVDTMLRLGRERPLLRVVDDQFGTPTFTNDAARTMVRIVEAGLSGTIHAANHGTTTWCRFARAVLLTAGLRTPVEAIRTEDFPTRAVRPRNSALENRVLFRTIGDTMRPWEECLREHLGGGDSG